MIANYLDYYTLGVAVGLIAMPIGMAIGHIWGHLDRTAKLFDED